MKHLESYSGYEGYVTGYFENIDEIGRYHEKINLRHNSISWALGMLRRVIL
jgi:hypothetical protein